MNCINHLHTFENTHYNDILEASKKKACMNSSQGENVPSYDKVPSHKEAELLGNPSFCHLCDFIN